MSADAWPDGVQPIAVIGMAGRFPGARSVAEYWDNLCRGVESIARFSAAEMLARGADPAMVADPHFVGAEGVLDDISCFDAEFFGYSPREAELMDPQHRLCLETAWQAFDSAGHDPAAVAGPVGVFLSASPSSYLIHHLLPNRQLIDLVGGFSLLIHNDKDFLPTTVSHKLDLRGPSMAVGSACSSSLVAVHLAGQSLRSFESDLAIAGGVSLQVPQPKGYVYAESGVYSPDGHCRAFDAEAAGTVGGSGVAVVLLKRWEDACRDGDHVHAVLLGSAVNNDGAVKQGYTAPGVHGQAAVIAEAQEVAGVSADQVGYVEAHGTGTQLGDTVELDALTRAFRRSSQRNQFCAVGSVKTNIGHLDAAAGVAALIKAVLAVEHGVIPASLHYRQPNPHIDLASSPFHINATTRQWRCDQPRTAGVSAFGIGGTNAHLVLQQPPATTRPGRVTRPAQPLVLSARSERMLATASRDLAEHLRRTPQVELADVAFTLGCRRTFPYRRVVVATDPSAAAAALADRPPPDSTGRQGGSPRRPRGLDVTGRWQGGPRPLVLLLPGQGAYDPQAAAQLYQDEPVFRAHLDACAAPLAAAGVDLPGVLASGEERAGPQVTQPVLFAVGHALACTLREWGLEPAAMLGHSLGEYVAATLAGVFTLDEAAWLVCQRGLLSAELPPGQLLAVPLSWAETTRRLPDLALACAAENGPGQCVLSGPPPVVAAAADALTQQGVHARPLPVTRAYHSPAVDAIRDRFLDAVRQLTPHPPQLRYVSNLTGDWARAEQVCQPEYWARHLREPVRFGAGVGKVLDLPEAIVLEAGLAARLAPLVRRHPACGPEHVVLACQARSRAGERQPAALTALAAQAWAAGAPMNWPAFHAAQSPRRVPVPPSPAERRRCWVEAPPASGASGPVPLSALVPALADQAAQARQARPIRAIEDYPGLRADLDRLCAALTVEYLTDAGVETAPGSRHLVGQLRQRLGVLDGYAKLLDYLLGILATDGILRRDGETLTFQDRDAILGHAPLAEQVKHRHPEFAGLVDLLVHCGTGYSHALSDRGAALGLLYPDGRGDLLQRLLGEQTVEHTHTGHLTQVVAELASRLAAAAGGRLRVLEVGAGAGRLTWPVAEALRAWPTDYLATDVGRPFVAHLADEARRRGLDLVRTGSLDISRHPERQGLAAGGFDLIIGLDVVHATRDVRVSLANLRWLLAPAGVLALVETTAADRWQSMIWGLSQEWWSFEDDLREHQPLLAPQEWARAVSETGFADSAVLPAPASGRPDSVLVLGQAAFATGYQPIDRPAQLPTTPETGAVGQPPRPRTAPGSAELPPKRPDPGDWLYLPSWTRAAGPRGDRRPDGGTLVFAAGPLGDTVAARLRQHGWQVAVVRPGTAFAVTGDDYLLDPAQPADYRSLLADLAGRWPVTNLVHAWQADPDTARLSLENLTERQLRGLHSLLFLAQAEGSRPSPTLRRLLAVTRGAQEVVGGDLAQPDQAMLNAAVKVLPMEYPGLTCRAVDLPAQAASSQRSWLADRVIDELLADSDPVTVAYRGRHRWRPSFAPLGPAAATAATPRPGGVYLITGGLGGIGLALGGYLAGLPAKVVLTGRTGLPPREEWEDLLRAEPADRRAVLIRRLLAAEAAGGELLVVRADVTSATDMQAVVDAALARFGPITGVIHAAGVTDQAGMIQRRTRAATDAAIAAKVEGTLVLDQVLAGCELDFFVLCSSLGPILHKLKFGEVGYVAGNEFLNAYAAHRAARGRSTLVSICWTDWLEAGMWARARHRLARYELAESDRPLPIQPTDDLLRGITDAEGVEVFRRVLDYRGEPQLVISTQDLDALVARHEAYTTSEHRDLLDRLQLAATPRPQRAGPAVAPRTPVEIAIAGMWEALLGVAEVGAGDNFFELGGDSLLALRFLSRLREELGVEHPIARMFEAPTVQAIAADVAGTGDRRADPAGDEPAGHEEVLL